MCILCKLLPGQHLRTKFSLMGSFAFVKQTRYDGHPQLSRVARKPQSGLNRSQRRIHTQSWMIHYACHDQLRVWFGKTKVPVSAFQLIIQFLTEFSATGWLISCMFDTLISHINMTSWLLFYRQNNFDQLGLKKKKMLLGFSLKTSAELHLWVDLAGLQYYAKNTYKHRTRLKCYLKLRVFPMNFFDFPECRLLLK